MHFFRTFLLKYFAGIEKSKSFVSLHQETNRDTDEVFRLVQSPRLEPHRKVNIRRVFLGQV